MEPIRNLKKEVKRILSTVSNGGTLENARYLLQGTISVYQIPLDSADPRVRYFLETATNARLGRDFSALCNSAINNGGDMLSTLQIAAMTGLELSTVQRHAKDCPGAKRFGNSWAFNNSSETWDYFGRIIPRTRHHVPPYPPPPYVTG